MTMAPRKNKVINTTQNQRKSVGTGITKRKREIPADIIIEVPVTKPTGTTCKVKRKKKKANNDCDMHCENIDCPCSTTKNEAKNIVKEHKIQLANEVAGLQLKKNLTNIKTKAPAIKVARGRGRPKNVSKLCTTEETLQGNANGSPVKKATKKSTLDTKVANNLKESVTRKNTLDSAPKLETSPQLKKANVVPRRRRICGKKSVDPKEKKVLGKDTGKKISPDENTDSGPTLVDVQNGKIELPETVSAYAGRTRSMKTGSSLVTLNTSSSKVTSTTSWIKDISSSETTSIISTDSNSVCRESNVFKENKKTVLYGIYDFASSPIKVGNNGVNRKVTKCAPCTGSRKTSSASTSSSSWSKSLCSSRDTSVIVNDSDFFCIDNRLPVIQLVNMDSEKIKEAAQSAQIETLSSVSSPSHRNVKSDESVDAFDIKSNNLNLSTSSLSSLRISHTAHVNTTRNDHRECDDVKNDLNEKFVKFSSLLESLDVEITNWIESTKDVDIITREFHDSILKVLTEESEVFTQCQHLRDLHFDNETEKVIKEKYIDDVDPTNSSNNKSECKKMSDTERNGRSKVYPNNVESGESCDDDAISIYAESLTGIDLDKSTNSVPTAEYIPQPIVHRIESPTQQYTYCPTKIDSNNHLVIKKSICEKQNADSTSIYKENEDDVHKPNEDAECQDSSNDCTTQNLNANAHDSEKLIENAQEVTNIEPYVNNYVHEPQLRSLTFNNANTPDNENLPKNVQEVTNTESYVNNYVRESQVRSLIFNYVCNGNLLNRCKNVHCRYQHVVPDELEVKKKLHLLSNEAFVTEYRAICHRVAICRKYGMCFIEECCLRDLPRVLVYMAKGIFVNIKIYRKEDRVYIREILERVLLRLNTVKPSIYQDLLEHSVTPTMLLCDVFMHVIAETQNFLRFKTVFTNLTNFVVNHNGIFNLFVAVNILERVSLLPVEKSMTRSVLDIVKNTDATIFKCKCMTDFENKLFLSDKPSYEELRTLKIQAGFLEGGSHNSVACAVNSKLEVSMPINNTSMNLDAKNSSSPDTTDVNGLKIHLSDDMARTVNFNRMSSKDVSNDVALNCNGRPYLQEPKTFFRPSSLQAHTHIPPLLQLPNTGQNLEPIKNTRFSSYRPSFSTYQNRCTKRFI